MKPPQKRPPVRLVEDNEAPTEGDFEFYRARRRAKYGPVPRSVRGEPLIRERLTSRKLESVVAHAIIDHPEHMSKVLLYIAGGLVGFFFLATGIAALAGVIAK